jgi:putative oxidoreductase
LFVAVVVAKSNFCGKPASTVTVLSKLVAPGNDSLPTSLGLLVLRLWLGLTLMLNHGLSKLKGFDSMASGFPDPLIVGHAASMALVVFAEVMASLLLAAGLLTWFAALVLVMNMAVAFFIVHEGALTGGHSGELAFIYLAAFVTLLVAGPGRFSLDKNFSVMEAKTEILRP